MRREAAAMSFDKSQSANMGRRYWRDDRHRNFRACTRAAGHMRA